jgi:hypothetical protein
MTHLIETKARRQFLIDRNLDGCKLNIPSDNSPPALVLLSARASRFGMIVHGHKPRTPRLERN